MGKGSRYKVLASGESPRRQGIRFKFFGFCSIALLFFCSSAFAASWYVDNTASGSNNGTSWTNAWQSFANIIWASISAGDTIYISGGSTSKTYKETLSISKSGASGNPITIKVGQDSGHDGTVIIDGDVDSSGTKNAGDLTNCIFMNTYDYITIDGSLGTSRKLYVKNSLNEGIKNSGAQSVILKYLEVFDNGDGGVSGAEHDEGVLLENCCDCEVSYCLVHDNWGDGINLNGSGPDTEYGRNKIHHNEVYNSGDDGITIRSSVDVYNNIIHDNYPRTINGTYQGGPSDLFHSDGTQVGGNYIRFYNNIIYNCRQLTFLNNLIGGGQISAHHRIYNNIYYLTDSNFPFTAPGIRCRSLDGGYDDIFIANNTFVDLKGEAFGISFDNPSYTLTNIVFKNNLIMNTSTAIRTSLWFEPGTYTASDLVIDYNIINSGSTGNNTIKWQNVDKTHSQFASENLGQKCGGTECSTTAPSFIRYTPYNVNNNLRLQSGSNGIDSGADLSSFFTTDKDSISRPRQSAWDKGAYERKDTKPMPPVAH